MDFSRRSLLTIHVQALWKTLGVVPKSGKVPLLSVTVSQQATNGPDRGQHPFGICCHGNVRICDVHASDHPHTALALMFRRVGLLRVVKPDAREENLTMGPVFHTLLLPLTQNHLPNAFGALVSGKHILQV